MNRPCRSSLTLLLLLLLSCSSPSWGQEGESLNFCDIPCVGRIYSQYCGDAKCTTGASDYAQIFTLCTETCAGAVAGEAMIQCLTTTVPDRADWPEVQDSVLDEIVSFCEGYQITISPDVEPLSLKDTDKKLLDTLFDEPEIEEETKSKKKKKNKKSKKSKGVESEEVQEENSKKKKRKTSTEEAPESTEATGKGRSRRRGKDTDADIAEEVVESVSTDSATEELAEEISNAFDAFGSLVSFDREDMEEVLGTSLEESISE